MELDGLLSNVPLFPFPVCCCNQASVQQFSLSTENPTALPDKAYSNGEAKPQSGHHSCCNRINSLSQLLDGLPSKGISDTLYHNFLNGIHPLTLLLHVPTFRSQYDRFWEWYSSWNPEESPSGIMAETPSFLPLLFAVLFAGSFGPQDTSLSPPDVTTLFNSHSHALSLVAFPQSPTIYSLCAFLIVQNLLVREEESLSACSFIGIALRAAQAMGLHRDGSHFHLDPVQAEIRRRLWYHVIHTDVMTSLSSGLPPLMIVDYLYDTKMITEVKDEYIGTEKQLLHEQSLSINSEAASGKQDTTVGATGSLDGSLICIYHVVAIGRYEITSLMRQLLRRQFSVEPITMEDIAALKRAVDQQSSRTAARIRRLKMMRLYDSKGEEIRAHRSPSFSGISVRPFQCWAQRLLRLMTHKAYSMLYQPLLRGKYGRVSSRARRDAIRHCHGYIDEYLDISTTELFKPFQWMYPGMYQPLQATAIILADLIKNPTTEEAQHSRTLVDRLFSLIGPDGFGWQTEKPSKRNLSPAGREAWQMLRKLRRQAWKAAGLDPEFVWTDSNQPAKAVNLEQPVQPPLDIPVNAVQNPVAEPVVTSPNVLSTAYTPEFGQYYDFNWSETFDFNASPSDQSGQFELGEIDGFDWQQWDFLLQQSFNMPDPGQSYF